MVPGNGVFVNAVELTTGVKAIVSGKPNTFCFDNIIELHSLKKEEVVFIGDNLKTDIQFSNSAGVDCILVLTGCTKEETLDKQLKDDDAGVPTYISKTLKL